MPNQVYTREEFARLQMEAVKRSGFSEHNSEAMREERQFEQELAAARAADNELIRSLDRDIVKHMLLLMRTIAEVRVHSQRGAPNVRSYEHSRRQVDAVVGIAASIIGPDAGSWTVVVDKLQYINNPATKGVADMANMTNSPTIKKIVGDLNDAFGFGSSVIGALGTVVRPIPDLVSAIFHPVSHFVGPAAAPFLSLIGRGITVATVLEKHSRLDPLLALWLRYDDSCSCCGSIKQVTHEWEKAVARMAMMAHPFYAVYFSGKKLVKKVTNMGLPAPGPLTAGKLWDAANDCFNTDHHFVKPNAVTLDHGQHCPFALLALATLFGRGDAREGYQSAVAALMSDRTSGTEEIAKLLS